MNDKDEELISKYNNGDEDSLRILIDRYTNHIYNFSVRFIGVNNTPDIVQDVFIKVWKNMGKFDISKSSFKTWLFTIARNTITDYLRKKKMKVFSELNKEDEEFTETIEDEALLQDEVIERLEDKEYLNSLLDKLPNNYKEVLILYYQEEMTFAEIGESVGKPLNTVKSWHRRALIKLREEIDR